MTRDTGPQLSIDPSRDDGGPVAAQIRVAFIQLAAERGYRGVKMADVAARAGMSRQNLYRYYRNREELYRATLDELFDRFWQQAEPLFEQFDDSLSGPVNRMAMVVARQHPDILRLLAEPDLHDLSLSLLRRYYARVLGALLRRRDGAVVQRPHMDVVVSMVAGASLAGLREWLEGDMQVSAEDMADIMSHVFNLRLVELIDRRA